MHAYGRRRPLRRAAGDEHARRRRDRLTVSIRKRRREQRLSQRRMEASSALVSGAADAPAQSGSPAPNWAGNQSLVPTEAPSFDAATTEPSDMDVAAESRIQKSAAILQSPERVLYQRALEDLVTSSSHRPTFIKAVFGASSLLPRIIHLLSAEFDADRTMQEYALRIILILSLGTSRHCLAIASTQAVPALLQLVDRSTAELRASSPAAKVAACPPAIHLAVSVLGNIAASSPTIQQELVDKGTIAAMARVADVLTTSTAHRTVPWVVQHLALCDLRQEEANCIARILSSLAIEVGEQCEELAAAMGVMAANHPDAVAFSGVLGRLAFLSSTFDSTGAEVPLEALLNVSHASDLHAQAVAAVALPHLHMYATTGHERTRTVAVEVLGNIAMGPPEQKQLLLNSSLWAAVTRPLGGRCTHATLRSACSAVVAALCLNCSLAQARWMLGGPHESVLQTAARALTITPRPTDRLTMVEGLRTLLPLAGMVAEEQGRSLLDVCDEAGLTGALEALCTDEHAELAAEAEQVYSHNFGGEMDMPLESDEDEHEDEEEDEEERRMLDRHLWAGAGDVPARDLVATFNGAGDAGTHGPAGAGQPLFTGFR